MRKFTIVDVDQHLEDGTANPDWLAARIGRVTGSTANDMLAVAKKPGEGMRANLIVRLAIERLTGKSLDKKKQTFEMAQGLKREPIGRFAYEKETGAVVHTVGFLAHNDLMAGVSPDGYVGDFEGTVSLKCPELTAHMDLIERGFAAITLDYKRQILHEQWMTGAHWTDFVSFNPDVPGRLALKIIRICRDEKAIEQHDADVRQFLAEVETKYNAWRTLADVGAVLQEAAVA